MFDSLKDGASCIAEGFRLIRRPGLRRYVAVPLLANVLLFGLSGYLVLHYLGGWVQGLHFEVDLWSWLDWLEPLIAGMAGALQWVVMIGAVLLLLFVAGSTFTMITHLLIGPFLGLLAEKVELQLHDARFPQVSLGRVVLRSLRRELQKLLYWLVRAAGLGVLSLVLWLIPPLNPATPVLWYLFGAWILAMQYLDVPADNNGHSFRQVLQIMKRRRVAVMGFGGIVMFLTAVPLVNLLIVPVATAGAVVFWLREIATETPPARPRSSPG